MTKIAAAAGTAAARIATAEEVRDMTGFDPGAVAPVALATPLRVIVDRGLFAWELVWVGAGSPHHVAGLAPRDLLKLTHGEPADLAETGANARLLAPND
jgi:prolyl-tRNA editing enzyme YbaK/EbsC (Cys-tRNA(Pro) deacylase)